MSRRHSLPALYRRLNCQYFRGRLPKYPIKRTDETREIGGQPITAGCNHEQRVIFLPRNVSQELLLRYLLYEMCHIETRDDIRLHGPRWCDCLRRVAAGAAWLEEELSWYEDRFPGYPPVLTGEQVVRLEIDSTARNLPGERWTKVRRRLAGAADIDNQAFDKGYPWALEKWLEAQTHQGARRSQTAF